MRKFGWYYELRDTDDPGGNGGDPPKEPEGGDPPEPPKVASIPLTALPEELRDKSEAEIQFTLGRLISGVTSANERNRDLQQRLDAANAVPELPKEPDPNADKTIGELFEEGEHEAAFDRYLAKKGYVDVVSGTVARVNSMEYDAVRRDIPDFDEFRSDVDDILEGRDNVDSQTIRAAYTMAVGAKVIADKEKAARALNSPEAIDGDPPAALEFGDMDSFEKEVFEASGMERKKWESMKGLDQEIAVPTSPGG